MTEAEVQEQLDMMLAPEKWPLGSILLLKNVKRRDKDGWPEYGLLWSGSIAFTIYLTNIHNWHPAHRDEYPYELYGVPSKAVEAGWIVD